MMLDVCVFTILVERQYWLANKCTKGFIVTGYTQYVSLSDNLVKWLHCNTIAHSQSAQSIKQSILVKQS